MLSNEISANIIFSDSFGCVSQERALRVVEEKTAFLQEVKLSFAVQNSDGVMTFTSNETYKDRPFVTIKIDCSISGVNGFGVQTPSVQISAVHRLHFFAASLPNFRTGRRIVIIPDNVVLVSAKRVTVGQN